MGTGTTGFVCAIYGTKFVGSEKDSAVFQLAESRIVSMFLTCDTAKSKLLVLFFYCLLTLFH